MPVDFKIVAELPLIVKFDVFSLVHETLLAVETVKLVATASACSPDANVTGVAANTIAGLL